VRAPSGERAWIWWPATSNWKVVVASTEVPTPTVRETTLPDRSVVCRVGPRSGSSAPLFEGGVVVVVVPSYDVVVTWRAVPDDVSATRTGRFTSSYVVMVCEGRVAVNVGSYHWPNGVPGVAVDAVAATTAVRLPRSSNREPVTTVPCFGPAVSSW